MSSELLLFNSQYAKVAINKNKQTALVYWKKQAHPDDFWEASYHVMQYIARGNTRYCVFIHEDIISIPQDHRLWMKYIAIPEAKKYGIKRLATLSPKSLPIRVAHNLVDILFWSRSLPHRCFSENNALFRWLYSV